MADELLADLGLGPEALEPAPKSTGGAAEEAPAPLEEGECPAARGAAPAASRARGPRDAFRTAGGTRARGAPRRV